MCSILIVVMVSWMYTCQIYQPVHFNSCTVYHVNYISKAVLKIMRQHYICIRTAQRNEKTDNISAGKNVSN